MTKIAMATARPESRARLDAYQAITDRIIAALERGTVPWRVPWRARGHRNALSGRPYRGINLLVLALTSLERGYDDARWLTYRQAATAAVMSDGVSRARRSCSGSGSSGATLPRAR